MSVGTPAAADVPGIFDVIINGQGYMLLRTVDTSLPFRTQRAAYGFTPTFLERQNVSGEFGDNDQDFFLTAAQNDFSGGEGQRHFRNTEAASRTMYYAGSKIDISTGEAALSNASIHVTLAAACTGATNVGDKFFVSSATNLYEVSNTGSITDRGAHGAGGAGTSLCTDGVYVYISGSACTKIRKYDISAHTFADFAAGAGADWITYLNNSLWGTKSGVLNYYSTAGAATAAYTWKDGIGGAITNVKKIIPFGGKIMALLPGSQNVNQTDELWVCDTTGAQRVAELPGGFSTDAIVESLGIVFVAGRERISGSSFSLAREAIYAYTNGTLEKLWSDLAYSNDGGTVSVIAPLRDGLLFTNRFYDLATGAVSTIAANSALPTAGGIAVAGPKCALYTTGSTDAYIVADASLWNSTGSMTSSLYDFGNSLTKLMRGIKIDFEGSGGSITADIAYSIDTLSGSYTTLQTNAVSGTEYPFGSTVTGRAISVKVTLNGSTSTGFPSLKKVYVRAAPGLQSYHRDEFILDLSGRDGHAHVVLNNGVDHPLDGLAQATNLLVAIQATSPFTVTTRHGSYTALLEPGQSELIEIRPEEYIARIVARGV